MIFGVIKNESIVQVSDQTRIDVSKSYVVNEASAITLIRVKPELSASYVDVTSSKYLDWQYVADGEKTITLEITTDGVPAEFTKVLSVLTIEDDYLFSNDEDLVDIEDDILNYVRAGRNSYLDKHRVAQKHIMTYLNDQRIWDTKGQKLGKKAVLKIDEVREWSKFMTLHLIYFSISNQTDDVFMVKADIYKKKFLDFRKSATLRLDTDGSGNENVNVEIKSIRAYVR